MNAHFFTNAAVTLFLLAAALYGLWSNDLFVLALKIAITPVAALVCLHIGHRYVPRVTGPIIESAFRKQNK